MTGAHAADSLTPLDGETEGRAGEGSAGAPDPAPAAGNAPAPVVLRFAPLPEHVRTARLVAVALARRAGVEDGLLDEVRLAVGEACSRAVGLHRSAAPSVPIVVHLDDGRERFGVEVVDVVSGGPVPKPEEGNAGENVGGDSAFGEEPDADMGLAVLRGLVDDLDVELTADGGVIRMGWPVVAPHWATH